MFVRSYYTYIKSMQQFWNESTSKVSNASAKRWSKKILNLIFAILKNDFLSTEYRLEERSFFKNRTIKQKWKKSVNNGIWKWTIHSDLADEEKRRSIRKMKNRERKTKKSGKTTENIFSQRFFLLKSLSLLKAYMGFRMFPFRRKGNCIP